MGACRKQISASERADGDAPVHVAIVALVPSIACQTAQAHFGYDRAHPQRLAEKFDRQRRAHDVASAIGADAIARITKGFTESPTSRPMSILWRDHEAYWHDLKVAKIEPPLWVVRSISRLAKEWRMAVYRASIVSGSA